MKISTIAMMANILTADASPIHDVRRLEASGFCEVRGGPALVPGTWGTEGTRCGNHNTCPGTPNLTVEECYQFIKVQPDGCNKYFVREDYEKSYCYPLNNDDYRYNGYSDGGVIISADGQCTYQNTSPAWYTGSGDFYGRFLTYLIHGDGTYWPSTYTCWDGTQLTQIDNSGTSSPTKNPSKSPTDSPTRTPWDITFDNSTTVVDFSSTSGFDNDDSGDEGVLTTKYSATAASDSARLETFLVNEVCNAATSGSDSVIRIPSGGVCLDNQAPFETDCTYKFEKTNFTTNFNFNTEDNKLKVCEVAQLSLPSATAGEDDLVIEEYFTNVEVTFNMTQGFDVEAVSMKKATIKSSTQETSLSEYISASQCDGPNTQLAPNDVLCVRISSSSPDVLIKTIDEMDIAGTNAQGVATLEVYDGKVIKYSAITSETNSPVGGGPARQRVEVRTRVPTNTFNFEALNAKIDITGSVTVEFAASRRLVSIDLDRLLQVNEGEETAKFGTTVTLAPEPKLDALEDGDAMMNSAKAMKAFATFGMVFAFTFALW